MFYVKINRIFLQFKVFSPIHPQIEFKNVSKAPKIARLDKFFLALIVTICLTVHISLFSFFESRGNKSAC